MSEAIRILTKELQRVEENVIYYTDECSKLRKRLRDVEASLPTYSRMITEIRYALSLLKASDAVKADIKAVVNE